MPWFIPYNRLDIDQKDFVDDVINNKLFISGFAGTGKSVVLIHKLIKIFDENPDAKCCVISFTHALLEMFKLGIEESGRLTGRVSNEINSCNAKNGQIDLVTKYEFRKNFQNTNPIRYDFIMIDEVQDLCQSDIENVLNSRTKEIYLGGDDNQSIYSEDPKDKESTLTAQRRNELIQTVDRSLVRLYRITPSILTVAKRIMPELNERLNGTQFGHNRDADVILASAEDERDEVQYVFENALTYAEDIELTAILLPKHLWIKDFCQYILEINNVELTPEILQFIKSRNYSELNKVFSENGIRLEYVGNDYGSFRNAKEKHNIVLMTYHSAKGMDFDNVFIPFLSSSRHERFSFFLPKPLMVAITRSNLNLTLSYSGESMAFVDSIRDACFEIDIDSDNDNDFLDY
jgi:superfamily I DNA/RNA helicase